jgi:hypothetical protein
MKTRYERGQFPEYHAHLSRCISESAILSRNRMSPEFFNPGARHLRGFIQEYESKLDRALKLIELVQLTFKERQLKLRREGRKELPELPPDLLAIQLRHEARADCILQEIAHFKELLAAAETRQQKVDESLVLAYGPQGDGRLRGGVLVELDGQPVVADAEGNLTVDCPKSPYHLMKVVDYREKVCDPWRAANTEKKQAAWEKARDETLSPSERQECLKIAQRMTVDWADLPPRPEGY